MCRMGVLMLYNDIQNMLISKQRKICRDRKLRGDKVGSLPKLCDNPELLQNTPAVDMDTNGAHFIFGYLLFYSQSPTSLAQGSQFLSCRMRIYFPLLVFVIDMVAKYFRNQN